MLPNSENWNYIHRGRMSPINVGLTEILYRPLLLQPNDNSFVSRHLGILAFLTVSFHLLRIQSEDVVTADVILQHLTVFSWIWGMFDIIIKIKQRLIFANIFYKIWVILRFI